MFIKVKVISRSRSHQGQSHSRSKLLEVKATQDQGHSSSRSVKVKVISRSQSMRSRSFWNQMAMCFDFYLGAGGWLSSQCLSLLLTCYFCIVLHFSEISLSLHFMSYRSFYATLLRTSKVNMYRIKNIKSGIMT